MLTLGAVGAAGVFSAGLLGTPGIGYIQDYYAAHKLSKEAPALHEQYVQITRKVAQQTHATLCDAARAFETNPVASATYFRKDNLHLSDAGDQALAELLADCIQGAWAAPRRAS